MLIKFALYTLVVLASFAAQSTDESYHYYSMSGGAVEIRIESEKEGKGSYWQGGYCHA